MTQEVSPIATAAQTSIVFGAYRYNAGGNRRGTGVEVKLDA
jgi:hypothetical protein